MDIGAHLTGNPIAERLIWDFSGEVLMGISSFIREVSPGNTLNPWTNEQTEPKTSNGPLSLEKVISADFMVININFFMPW